MVGRPPYIQSRRPPPSCSLGSGGWRYPSLAVGPLVLARDEPAQAFAGGALGLPSLPKPCPSSATCSCRPLYLPCVFFHGSVPGCRCKDEFGQLDVRVKGIQIVRETVEEGWKNRAVGAGVSAVVGGVKREPEEAADDGARQPVANSASTGRDATADGGWRHRAKREGLPKENSGGGGVSEEGALESGAQKHSAKAIRTSVADGWRYRGKKVEGGVPGVESEPEEGAIEDGPKQGAARNAPPTVAAFRGGGIRGSVPNR